MEILCGTLKIFTLGWLSGNIFTIIWKCSIIKFFCKAFQVINEVHMYINSASSIIIINICVSTDTGFHWIYGDPDQSFQENPFVEGWSYYRIMCSAIKGISKDQVASCFNSNIHVKIFFKHFYFIQCIMTKIISDFSKFTELEIIEPWHKYIYFCLVSSLSHVDFLILSL